MPAPTITYTHLPDDSTPANPSFDAAAVARLRTNPGSLGFRPRPADVYVVTYPKSGTTLTQQLVHLLLPEGSPDPSPSYRHSVPWLAAGLCAGRDLAAREAPSATTAALVEARPSPRVFKSHAARPAALPPGSRVVYVARNPLDVAVSLWRHTRDKPEFRAPGLAWADFYARFMRGAVEGGSWFEHVRAWRGAAAHEVLWLTYEGIVADRAAAARRIAAFVGLPALDAAALAAVAENATLDAMRRGAASDIGMGHLGRGSVGAWREVFDADQGASLTPHPSPPSPLPSQRTKPSGSSTRPPPCSGPSSRRRRPSTAAAASACRSRSRRPALRRRRRRFPRAGRCASSAPGRRG